jgi:bifunctional UDP-N-acetylglucosamine pyrophosphorylase/glucosamine-1-phosphate N-acetyltransferase
MSVRNCLAIVLAAGEGTRMRSALPKVLHAIAGRPLLAHVLRAVAETKATAVAVVVGPDQEAVAAEAERVLPGAQCFVQHERRGTAHAVLAARAALKGKPDDILIVYGDTPLLRAETLNKLRAP